MFTSPERPGRGPSHEGRHPPSGPLKKNLSLGGLLTTFRCEGHVYIEHSGSYEHADAREGLTNTEVAIACSPAVLVGLENIPNKVSMEPLLHLETGYVITLLMIFEIGVVERKSYTSRQSQG